MGMEPSFRSTPDIHSYNALLCPFGKLHKRDEAVKVFEHLVGLVVKPNAKSYALLIDAYLIKGDPKAAFSTTNDMVDDGGIFRGNTRQVGLHDYNLNPIV